jgi:hypothetical protein
MKGVDGTGSPGSGRWFHALAVMARGENCQAPTATLMLENKNRPAWVNWLFLGIFLWSSWQLAGFWFAQLHG